MRKNIVAGNWKMNTTVPEGVQLAKDVCAAVAAERSSATLKWVWQLRTAPTTPAVPTPVRFRLPW